MPKTVTLPLLKPCQRRLYKTAAEAKLNERFVLDILLAARVLRAFTCYHLAQASWFLPGTAACREQLKVC
jgi:hypothetical protein